MREGIKIKGLSTFAFIGLLFFLFGCAENNVIVIPASLDLNEVNDVNSINPAQNQIIAWDVPSAKWKNVDLNGADFNGIPSGANLNLQFNDNGAFGGAIGLDYNKDSRQLISTLVIAPLPNFVVNSTTLVDNLNADFVDGFTFNQDLRTSQNVQFHDLNLSPAGGIIPIFYLKSTANRFVKLGLPANATVGGYDWNFPAAQGGAGTFLQNNGSGQTSWQSVSVSSGVSGIVAGGNIDVNSLTGNVLVSVDDANLALNYYKQTDANNVFIKITDSNNVSRLDQKVIRDLNKAFYGQIDANNVFIKIVDSNNVSRLDQRVIRDGNKIFYTQSDLNGNGLFIKTSDSNNVSRLDQKVIRDLNKAFYGQIDANNVFIKITDSNNVSRLDQKVIRDLNKAFYGQTDANNVFINKADGNSLYVLKNPLAVQTISGFDLNLLFGLRARDVNAVRDINAGNFLKSGGNRLCNNTVCYNIDDLNTHASLGAVSVTRIIAGFGIDVNSAIGDVNISTDISDLNSVFVNRNGSTPLTAYWNSMKNIAVKHLYVDFLEGVGLVGTNGGFGSWLFYEGNVVDLNDASLRLGNFGSVTEGKVTFVSASGDDFSVKTDAAIFKITNETDGREDIKISGTGDVTIDQNLTVSNGTNQSGITLTSPNGSEFCVVVSNLGVLTAGAGACG